MELDSLRDLYVDELKDIYNAETQLVKALPKMAKAANDPGLRRAFEEHLHATEGHVERLEEIFNTMDLSPKGKKCIGMEGIIKEANELISEDPDPDVLDAGLIGKAQHAEHYEMAGYGTLRTFAQYLGEQRHMELLQATLDEEKEADLLLTDLAQASVNMRAGRAD